MSEEDVFGIFFEDSYEEYLVATCETEEQAKEQSVALSERAYEEAWNDYEGEGPEPEWSASRGIHYVQPIARDLVDFDLLERGFAQRTA